MEQDQTLPELTPNFPAQAHACTGRTRHDGWTGERMATFLETLADTGIVAEGWRAAGMSKQAAYALRNRDPVFAAAWRAAQGQARPLVADGLLERSISGTVEHYYRDGVLVGERRHYESWLGLAVLKRLDKLVEEDRADDTLAARIAGDWQAAMDALRADGTAAVAAIEGDKVDQLDSPPSPPGIDPFDAVRRNDDGSWMTTHLPPPGFTGWETGEWDGDRWYERACTAEESALLDAYEAAMIEQERRELVEYAEQERESFFDGLRRDTSAAAAFPGIAPDCDGPDPLLEPPE